MKKIVLNILTCIILTSCSQNLFNFTIISTKNISIERLSLLEKSSEKTIGEDKTNIIILVPTRKTKIDKAITNTIDGIPGCVALLDGVVYSKLWYIPYIYGRQKYVVEATPLIDTSIDKSLKLLPKYGKILLDKNGKIKSMKSISKEEFAFEKNKL